MIRTLVTGAVAAAGVAGLSSEAAAESYWAKDPYAPAYKTASHHSDKSVASVRTADLNLQNEAGAEVLERRLRRAATQVCGGQQYGTVSLAMRSAHRACVRESLANALVQVDAPLVLARFDDVRGQTFVTALTDSFKALR
ncbi:MAG: UrcA family protein [Hyphomonadaceae bacterium]|nr:UrcA family protein [Hyphomonadaceae bacterium]